MKNLIIYMGLAILYSTNIVFCQSNDIHFRLISPKGGFSYNEIRNITEDGKGSIWFSTQDALYSYNSSELKKHRNFREGRHTYSLANVRNLHYDTSGKIWIATNSGLYCYDEDTEQFFRKQFYDREGSVISNNVAKVFQDNEDRFFIISDNNLFNIIAGTEIAEKLPIDLREQYDSPSQACIDRYGNLWLGTRRGFLYKAVPPYQTFKLIIQRQTSRIVDICFDNDSLWIGYEWHGVDCIDTTGKVIEHYDYESKGKLHLPFNRVRRIIKDIDDNIWIATSLGLQVLRSDKEYSTTYTTSDGLPNRSVFELFADSKNGIWVGTFSGGLVYYNRYDNNFNHYQKTPDPNSLSANIVSSFSEDAKGNIWIGTENGEINLFNQDRNTFSKLAISEGERKTDNIKALEFDRFDRLWIGTSYYGLWYKDNDAIYHFDRFDDQRISFYSIQATKDGLWLGSNKYGLFFYSFIDDQLKNFRANELNPLGLSHNTIFALYLDSKQNLWIGTKKGLCKLEAGQSNFKRYFNNEANEHGLSSNVIYAINEDINGTIWIGTEGGGINKFDRNEFTHYTVDDGLSGNSVYGIQIDKAGIIWLSTDNGISSFNSETLQFRNFIADDGLQGNQFSPGASFKSKTGDIWFGGSNGFNVFKPQNIRLNPIPPRTIITSLYINDSKVNISDPQSPLKKSLNNTNKIILNHNQNSLTFGFVADNYLLPSKNQFKYRLLYYSDQWHVAGKDLFATYTKIPSGHYIFEVISCNNDGIWNKNPTRLEIYIKKPIWRTWYAYLVYMIIIALIGFFTSKELILRQNLKNQIKVGKLQLEHDEKLHKAKTQFFTNVSHEFRTPLTLILSPLENVLSHNLTGNDLTSNLTVMRRNARRLKRLIEQVIDFRKIELGNLPFNPVETDIVKLAQEVWDCFKVNANDNNINFTLESELSSIPIIVDSDKMDKVFSNLLSNAFKYTPAEGSISLVISIDKSPNNPISEGIYSIVGDDLHEAAISIEVSDSGSGIPEERLPHLFERFYRSENHEVPGMGIGLHMVLEYTKMHGGQIIVNSIVDQGSSFKILLPFKHDGEIVRDAGVNETYQAKLKATSMEDSKGKDAIPGMQCACILFVEDNADFRNYIKKLLTPRYKVITAINGQQGFEMAVELNPDIIISDVMMPVMDGFQLCNEIKQEIKTSHIPVILLTSLSETDKHIEGLQTGADGYVTKPFNEELLISQVENLLLSKERLRNYFIESKSKWSKEINKHSSDRNLVEKAVGIVEDNLLNVSFSIDLFAEELNLSRSSLHRKLKALTNQTASEFITYIRLSKALKIFKSGNTNIEEVGFSVGFNSHSYFTRCFKKQFGESPKEYIQNMGLKNLSV